MAPYYKHAALYPKAPYFYINLKILAFLSDFVPTAPETVRAQQRALPVSVEAKKQQKQKHSGFSTISRCRCRLPQGR